MLAAFPAACLGQDIPLIEFSGDGQPARRQTLAAFLLDTGRHAAVKGLPHRAGDAGPGSAGCFEKRATGLGGRAVAGHLERIFGHTDVGDVIAKLV